MKPREEQILRFIKDYGLEHGFLPTVREICDGVNLKSTSSVSLHLANLEKLGYIKRDTGSPRYSVKGLWYVEG